MRDNQQALLIARRLAIQLMHEAQVAAPAPIHGFIGAAADGNPASFAREPGQLAARGETIWAEVFSNPTAPAIPDSSQLSEDGLTLMISLTTKGVLQMRAWTLRKGQNAEIGLKIME